MDGYKELQRAITLKELAPSPYFSVINVHLVDKHVFAEFYGIPSLPFPDIEKTKTSQTDVKTVYPPTHIVWGGGIITWG